MINPINFFRIYDTSLDNLLIINLKIISKEKNSDPKKLKFNTMSRTTGCFFYFPVSTIRISRDLLDRF